MPPPRRATRNGSVKVGAEALLAWKPDIVFVNYYNDTIKPEDIFGHPVLSGLEAVKAGRVYKTPAIDPATAAGGELTYQWFAKIGYPDLFQTDVRAAVAEGLQAPLRRRADRRRSSTRFCRWSWNGKSAGYAAAFAGKP